MIKKIASRCAIVSILLLLLVGCSNSEDEQVRNIQINISVASSLKDSMLHIKKQYEQSNEEVELVINYGSSGALKQQIEHGAPCDLFISAGKDQVDELDKKRLLVTESIKPLLKNKLVAIAPIDSRLSSLDDIKTKDVKYIGMGNPESVPVGKYTQEALKKLNLEEQISNKVVYAKDVKEVLSWVQLNNIDVGFVYHTDTIKNDKVKVLEKINPTNHSEIIYPVAIIENGKNIDEVNKFYDFLLSEKCKSIFKEYGYE